MASVRVDVFASGGKNTVTGSNFDDSLGGGAGNDTLNGGNGNGNGNDLPFGDIGTESLSSGPGNDTIYSDSADILINGGTGTDALYGPPASAPTSISPLTRSNSRRRLTITTR